MKQVFYKIVLPVWTIQTILLVFHELYYNQRNFGLNAAFLFLLFLLYSKIFSSSKGNNTQPSTNDILFFKYAYAFLNVLYLICINLDKPIFMFQLSLKLYMSCSSLARIVFELLLASVFMF